MYLYPELEQLVIFLEEVNIHVVDDAGPAGSRSGYNITFNGSEDEFVNALEMMMLDGTYYKQDDNWFPGDPGKCGEMDYYIMSNDVEFCISFENKILSELV